MKNYLEKRHTYDDRNTFRIHLNKEMESYTVNSEDLHLTYDKMYDNIGKLIKLKIVCDKISDTMKGKQIQLEYQWKVSGDIFW